MGFTTSLEKRPSHTRPDGVNATINQFPHDQLYACSNLEPTFSNHKGMMALIKYQPYAKPNTCEW